MKPLIVSAVSIFLIFAAASIAATWAAAAPHDPGRLLSPEAAANVAEAATAFERATGRRMAVIVLPRGAVPDLEALSSPIGGTEARTGIIYAISPDDPAGRLFIVDPAWQKALPRQWESMFPQRLAQIYGAEPFEAKVVRSAEYLAEVFADKAAFVMKPRGGKLSEGSLRFSRGAYIGIEILGYIIILLTVFRTFWPARLRDDDTDDFSNELRRLKKERQIW